MEKENGTILLKSVIPNWKNAIKKHIVVPNNLCGPFYDGYWLRGIEDKNWFLKISHLTSLRKELIVELLAEELARNIPIETISSEIVFCGNDKYGLISQSYLVSDYTIGSGSTISLEYFQKEMPPTLETIWESLNYHFREYPNRKNIILGFMKELTERYVFSFITMNRDFHLKNFEFLENNQHAVLVPMYDMDLSFDTHFEEKHNSLMAINTENIYEDFKNYYYSSSEYFQKEVERMLSILTPEFIWKSLETVEHLHGLIIPENIKKNIYTTYEVHYEKIKNSIKKKGRSL